MVIFGTPQRKCRARSLVSHNLILLARQTKPPLPMRPQTLKKRPRTSLGSPPHQIPQFQDADAKLDYWMNLSITLLGKHDALLEKHNEVLDELRSLRADHTALQQRTNEYAARLEVMEKKADTDAATLAELKNENRLLQDYSRADNFILHGVPTVSNDSNPADVVMMVAKAVKFDLTYRDFSACHLIGAPRNGTCKIVCRFVNRWQRNQVLWAINKKKFTTSDFDMPGERRNVFVTDHLSPESAKLLAEAKQTLTVRFGGPFHSIWSHNRKIFIRRRDKEAPFELKSYAHLRSLQSSLPQHMEGVQLTHNGSQSSSR